ncbi:HWE histidine kinase domain-containing protein [Aestuariibius sp. 2305UL40-4]|uniref:HWE histidine kinase domain-containing protein n=1 Tax=Aestuariibius violaceus TaxID=3234132 RepID=UPI00345E244E
MRKIIPATPASNASQTVDLSNCDREPIHIPGRIQFFGCLIAVSQDWIITHLSGNATEMIGLDPDTAIGTPLRDHLPPETIHAVRSRLQIAAHSDAQARLFNVAALNDERLFDIVVHQSGSNWVIEFEPKTEVRGAQEAAWAVQPLIARVGRRKTIEGLAEEGAKSVKALSGFDRVMVYRFEEDGSGTVLAEAKMPGMQPFLGLRFPASDIPQQARALYVKNPIRIISDVESEVFDLIPQQGPDGTPLDLTMSVTRAVSPIHLEYLRNMGVCASMSVSILKDGALWGLFACHHNSPRLLAYEQRSMIELFAQLFAYELALKEAEQDRAEADQARVLHDQLMAQVSDGRSFVNNFETVAEDIRRVIGFDGIVLSAEDRFVSLGSTPTEDEFRELTRFLNTSAASSVFHTDCLSARYTPAEDYVERAAGAMALPISRRPRDYIVLFRREVARAVQWGGNPDKPVEAGPNGVRLTPRKSFEAWKQIVKGHSSPWSRAELNAAEALRVTLLEAILKVADAAAHERKRAAEKQDLLIAELNHRVRNILTLIQGLVSQGKAEAVSIESYSRELDGRIQALARAHDMLTAESWSPTSLVQLIEVEAEAFLSEGTERLKIEGDDVLLAPDATTTLALVLHELVTNSAKYGALSVATGRVDVTIRRTETDALSFDWVEAGGPPVRAPKRKGFGTTVIERSVPFELKGDAEMEFRLTGVQARFVVPERFVSNAPKRTGRGRSTPKIAKVDGPLPDSLLVVEDNMIIAFDTMEMAREMGVGTVLSAASVSDAIRIIDTEEIGCALLDVNLGGETSATIAAELERRGIPFALATGYGRSQELLGNYPDALILSKPFGNEALRSTLIRLAGDQA